MRTLSAAMIAAMERDAWTPHAELDIITGPPPVSEVWTNSQLTLDTGQDDDNHPYVIDMVEAGGYLWVLKQGLVNSTTSYVDCYNFDGTLRGTASNRFGFSVVSACKAISFYNNYLYCFYSGSDGSGGGCRVYSLSGSRSTSREFTFASDVYLMDSGVTFGVDADSNNRLYIASGDTDNSTLEIDVFTVTGTKRSADTIVLDDTFNFTWGMTYRDGKLYFRDLFADAVFSVEIDNPETNDDDEAIPVDVGAEFPNISIYGLVYEGDVIYGATDSTLRLSTLTEVTGDAPVDHFCTRLDCPDKITGTALVGAVVAEEPFGGTARFIIKQPNAELDDKDYKGRQVQCRFGYLTAVSTPVEDDYQAEELQPWWVIYHSIVSESGSLYAIIDCENLWGRLNMEPIGTQGASEAAAAPFWNATVNATGGFVPKRTDSILEIIRDLLKARPPGFTASGFTVTLQDLLQGNITASITDGTGYRLTDDTGNFASRGIYEGDAIVNYEGGRIWRIDTLDEANNYIHVRPFAGDSSTDAWDSTDTLYGILDGDFYGNLRPMLVFRWNTPALEIIQIVMDMTQSGLLIVEGGNVRPVLLRPSKATNEYSFGATGKIQPLSYMRQSEVIRPNRVFVVDAEPAPGGEQISRYSGVARDTASEDSYGVLPALFGPTTQEQSFENQDEADQRAANILRRIISESASGIIVCNPHPGVEIFDRISAEDSRSEIDNEAIPMDGLVGRVEWRMNLDSHFGAKVYEQEIRIGGLRRYAYTAFGGQYFANEGVNEGFPEYGDTPFSEFLALLRAINRNDVPAYTMADDDGSSMTTSDGEVIITESDETFLDETTDSIVTTLMTSNNPFGRPDLRITAAPDHVAAGSGSLTPNVGGIPRYADLAGGVSRPRSRSRLFNALFNPPAPFPSSLTQQGILQNTLQDLQARMDSLETARRGASLHDPAALRALLRSRTVVIPGLDTDEPRPRFRSNNPFGR